jgi:hypothetical protein
MAGLAERLTKPREKFEGDVSGDNFLLSIGYVA